MLHVLFGLAVAAAVVASPFVSRRLRAGLNQQAPGAAVVSPVRSSPAGGMAVPVITDLDERQAFAYDNGLAVEEES